MTEHEDGETFTYLCIGCPLGCRLEVDTDAAGDIFEVRGSSCRKGDRYAVQEHTDPRRAVATTVAVRGGQWNRVPVKTSIDIPRDLVWEAVRSLGSVRVDAPVRLGQVIVQDLLGTGADVVATADMPTAQAVDRSVAAAAG